MRRVSLSAYLDGALERLELVLAADRAAGVGLRTLEDRLSQPLLAPRAVRSSSSAEAIASDASRTKQQELHDAIREMKLRIALKERRAKRRKTESSATSAAAVRKGNDVDGDSPPGVVDGASARQLEMDALRERMVTLKRQRAQCERSESPPPPRKQPSPLRSPPPEQQHQQRSAPAAVYLEASKSEPRTRQRDASTERRVVAAAISAGLLLWPPAAVARALHLEPARLVRVDAVAPWSAHRIDAGAVEVLHRNAGGGSGGGGALLHARGFLAARIVRHVQRMAPATWLRAQGVPALRPRAGAGEAAGGGEEEEAALALMPRDVAALYGAFAAHMVERVCAMTRDAASLKTQVADAEAALAHAELRFARLESDVGAHQAAHGKLTATLEELRRVSPASVLEASRGGSAAIEVEMEEERECERVGPDAWVDASRDIDFDHPPPSVSANSTGIPLLLVHHADALEAAPAAGAAASSCGVAEAEDDWVAAAAAAAVGPPRVVLRFACSGWALVRHDGVTHYACEASGESMSVLPFAALTEYAVFVFLAIELEKRGAVDDASAVAQNGLQSHLFNLRSHDKLTRKVFDPAKMSLSAAMLVEFKLVHKNLVGFALSANARECFGLTAKVSRGKTGARADRHIWLKKAGRQLLHQRPSGAVPKDALMACGATVAQQKGLQRVQVLLHEGLRKRAHVA